MTTMQRHQTIVQRQFWGTVFTLLLAVSTATAQARLALSPLGTVSDLQTTVTTGAIQSPLQDIRDGLPDPDAGLGSDPRETTCRPHGVRVNAQLLLLECWPDSYSDDGFGPHPTRYALEVSSPMAPLFLQLIQTARMMQTRLALRGSVVELTGVISGKVSVSGGANDQDMRTLWIEYENNPLLSRDINCEDDCRRVLSVGVTHQTK